MRYRITFIKDAPPSFQVVVYRDFEEPEEAENQSFIKKKIVSIARVHSTLAVEMRDQIAFRLLSIEEVPMDYPTTRDENLLASQAGTPESPGDKSNGASSTSFSA
ncbi:MAG: hypothetical protein ABSF83_14750 [Nitrososphaerales archaeon]|jgi:hypothetical protein